MQANYHLALNKRMKRRTYPRQQIEGLEQQINSLKLLVSELEAQKRSLSVQHTVLTRCCDILHSLRTGAMHRDWLEQKDSWLPEELSLLQDLGTQVASLNLHNGNGQSSTQQQEPADQQCTLQQGHAHLQLVPVCIAEELQPRSMSSKSATGSRSSSFTSEQQLPDMATDAFAAAAAVSSAQPKQHFLADQGDILGPLRYSLSQPPYPGADSMTLQQLVEYYSAMVKNLALNLSLVEQMQERGADDMCCGSQEPAEALAEIIRQHTRCIITILLLHPDDLLHKFRVVNLNTLELSDNPEQAWKRTCWIATKIKLSEQQQHTLSAGSLLFKRLLDNIRSERQQLAAQQAQQAQERLPTGRAVDLEGLQETAMRLQLLVKKERFLLTCASAFVCSVLDVVQLAMCCVMAWPWTPHLAMLAAVVAAQLSSKPATTPSTTGKAAKAAGAAGRRRPGDAPGHWSTQ